MSIVLANHKLKWGGSVKGKCQLVSYKQKVGKKILTFYRNDSTYKAANTLGTFVLVYKQKHLSKYSENSN